MNCSEQFEDAEDDNSLPHCVKNPAEKIDDVAQLISEANINESDDEYNDASESETDSEEDFIDGLEGGDITKKYITAVQHRQSNPQRTAQTDKSDFQPQQKLLGKYADKANFSFSSRGDFGRSAKSSDKHKDKADRATAEQVMDPRTRMIIFKMISRQIISEVHGCISTGKEANVYFATNHLNEQRALKVYKTSILVFKDRDKYVTGEFRFRHGYCRHNPRKMVATWAEKEMRNLLRIHQSGILCPKPYYLRSHVLVMEFIGKDGWPSPLLKDVELSESKSRELYLDCLHAMRTLYHTCKLVHADLSEFNIICHDEKMYFIDVSQSVEHDHPHALEFLRKDCTNVAEFFRRKGVATMTVKELFDFITDVTITAESIDDYLDRAMKRASERTAESVTEQEKVDEAVFKQAFIPRTLEDVPNFERDFRRAQSGTDAGLIFYQTLTGMKDDLTGPKADQQGGQGQGDDESSDSEKSDDVGSGDKEEESDSEKPDAKIDPTIIRPRDESPNSKKERKKAVKEAQREKRKVKIPKHEKKRKVKVSQSKK
jgi:RIO kinase 1